MSLLWNALFADSETTGLQRTASPHEFSIFNYASGELLEYTVEPNLVSLETRGEQDLLRLSTYRSDKIVREEVSTWEEVLRRQLISQGVNISPTDDLVSKLKSHASWLYRQLQSGLYPHLQGQTLNVNPARDAILRQYGVKTHIKRHVGVEDLLKELPEALGKDFNGKRLWLANAAFESKIFGAQYAASPTHLPQLKALLETSGEGSEPFYTTGRAVSHARTMASITGDWRPVWKAYQVPHEGLAIGDVIDVTKAFHSYGQSLGLLSERPTVGNSLDITSRLLASVFNESLPKEFHKSAEDSVIHTPYVLSRLERLITAAQAVEESTPLGRQLLQQAQSGQGDFALVANYFSNLHAILPDLQRQNAVQRLSRAQIEIQQKGFATQQEGVSSIYRARKTSFSGEVIEESRPIYGHSRYTSIDQVANRIKNEYGSNIDGEVSTIRDLSNPRDIARYERSVQVATDLAIDKKLSKPVVSTAGKQIALARNLNILKQVPNGKLGLTIGAIGLGLGIMSSGSQPNEESVLSYNYEQWAGMRHDGPIGKMRRENTDFGSPYRGPETSLTVLANSKLLEERERVQREQYGFSHYDPEAGVMNVFRRPSLGYQFIQDTESLGNVAPELRNRKNLRLLNIDKSMYNAELEDPDTLVLKRRGLAGALQRFIGQGSYAFRLEGLDSPEISHGSGYHAPQPGATMAAKMASDFIAGKQLQLVINPDQTTYGRQVASLYTDGNPYSIEAIRRGYAAFLPFGKGSDATQNWKELEAAEKSAFQGKRGIWSTPWAQTMYNAASPQERVTFNTLTRPERIVANSSTLSLITMMEHSQDKGEVINWSWNAQKYPDSNAVFHKENQGLELERDMTNWVSTRGGQNPLNTTEYLDQKLNSTAMTYKARPKRYANNYRYEINKQRQAEEQRRLNNSMFNSPINHQRM